MSAEATWVDESDLPWIVDFGTARPGTTAAGPLFGDFDSPAEARAWAARKYPGEAVEIRPKFPPN